MEMVLNKEKQIVSMRLIIKKFTLFFIGNPRLNIFMQHIVRPINEHKTILKTILKTQSFPTILDYGCGEGIFCSVFSKKNYVGFDVDKKKIKYAQKRFPQYRFSNHVSKTKKDLMFFNNVFHHLTESQMAKIFTKNSTNHILLIELKPETEQQKLWFKLLLRMEASIHYSVPRSANFYKTFFKRKDFSLQKELNLDKFFLQYYSRK